MDWDFFKAALAGGGVTSGLLAIAAFLGRSQLAHWLNKDIEQIKARHQRDLETYKVSLIADAEKLKGMQSVKTAAALKVSEQKCAALLELSASCRNIAPKVLSHCAMQYPNAEVFFEHFRKTDELMDRASAAIEAVAAFISPQDDRVFLALEGELRRVLGLSLGRVNRLSDEELEEAQKQLIESHSSANQRISILLAEMLEMA